MQNNLSCNLYDVTLIRFNFFRQEGIIMEFNYSLYQYSILPSDIVEQMAPVVCLR